MPLPLTVEPRTPVPPVREPGGTIPLDCPTAPLLPAVVLDVVVVVVVGRPLDAAVLAPLVAPPLLLTPRMPPLPRVVAALFSVSSLSSSRRRRASSRSSSSLSRCLLRCSKVSSSSRMASSCFDWSCVCPCQAGSRSKDWWFAERSSKSM